MKKTVSIHMAGVAFIVDEDAYQTLQNYLNTIEGYFTESAGKKEIMDDIEARIAELLNEYTSDHKQVITIDHINRVIQVMGKPEEYASDNTHTKTKYNDYNEQEKNILNKKIYRDIDGRVLGGVCSGLSYYFNIDKVWIRLLFVLIVFLGGSGVLIYIILWIVIPKANTTAEKLEMKGQKIDFDTIGKAVEEEMGQVKQKMDEFSSDFKKKSKKPIDNLTQFAINIANTLSRAIMIFIGVILLGISLFTLFLFLTFLLSQKIFVQWSEQGTQTIPVEIFNRIFSNPVDQWIMQISIALIMISVFSFFAWISIKLIFNIKNKIKYVGIAGLMIFLVGIFSFIYSLAKLSQEFSKTDTVEEKISCNITSDTLYLKSAQKKDNFSNNIVLFNQEINTNDLGELSLNFIQMKVKKSPNDCAFKKKKKTSHGANKEDASKYSKKIMYPLEIKENSIIFPIQFLTQTNMFRMQEITCDIYIPVGKTIVLDSEILKLMDKEEDEGFSWKMTNEGIVKSI